jgi:hypothetical protein
MYNTLCVCIHPQTPSPLPSLCSRSLSLFSHALNLGGISHGVTLVHARWEGLGVCLSPASRWQGRILAPSAGCISIALCLSCVLITTRVGRSVGEEGHSNSGQFHDGVFMWFSFLGMFGLWLLYNMAVGSHALSQLFDTQIILPQY